VVLRKMIMLIGLSIAFYISYNRIRMNLRDIKELTQVYGYYGEIEK